MCSHVWPNRHGLSPVCVSLGFLCSTAPFLAVLQKQLAGWVENYLTTAEVSAPQSPQQMWTIAQHDGADPLGIAVDQEGEPSHNIMIPILRLQLAVKQASHGCFQPHSPWRIPTAAASSHVFVGRAGRGYEGAAEGGARCDLRGRGRRALLLLDSPCSKHGLFFR